MARFETVLGNLSGKVGDVVFRTRGGKTFVARAPRKGTQVYSEERLIHQRKFAAAGKIASAINGIPELKQIWLGMGNYYKSTIQSKIMKEIFSQLGKEGISKIRFILPDDGEDIYGCVTIGAENIIVETVDYKPETGADPKEKGLTFAAGIVILRDPINSVDKPLHVLKMSSGIQELKRGQAATFPIRFSGMDLTTYCSYNTKEVHVHLITVDSRKNVIRYSIEISE